MQKNISEALHTLSSLGSLLEEKKSILVQADASDALISLNKYKELAKLILIDPPYNRRTKFHHYDDNTCSDKWVIKLKEHCTGLRNLLTEDGSLWMHIDDAEMYPARMMLDSLFGPSNFIATIVWQKTVSRDNRTAISTTHEYILVYAKNKTLWKKNRHKLPPTTEQLDRYKNRDNDPRGVWTSGDLTAKAGPGRRASQFYELELPSGRIVYPATGTSWRYTRERLEELIDDNRIYFGEGNTMPRLKRFLSEVDPGLVPDTWWTGSDVGTADTAKRHLKSMFPSITPFETPKPEELTSRILHIASSPGDLVIDIYAGSGTTAAVSQKMGRRWLTIEKEKRTFSEFTFPRIELVSKGMDPGGVTDKYNWNGGSDFIVLES